MTAGPQGIMGILVTIKETKGSVPREAGTTMWIEAARTEGTIGGGNLEFQAIEQARKLLAMPDKSEATQKYALGPLLEQCCGGSVVLSLEKMSRGNGVAARKKAMAAETRYPLYVFGAGHVGKAVVNAVSPLPFKVVWVDQRAHEFPTDVRDIVAQDHTSNPVDVVEAAESGALFLIFTHSHQLDYEIAAAALKRGDARYVGLIGSETKRARFESHVRKDGVLNDEELKGLTCPIGVSGIEGKEPEVIAAAVAAQLLQHL